MLNAFCASENCDAFIVLRSFPSQEIYRKTRTKTAQFEGPPARGHGKKGDGDDGGIGRSLEHRNDQGKAPMGQWPSREDEQNQQGRDRQALRKRPANTFGLGRDVEA